MLNIFEDIRRKEREGRRDDFMAAAGIPLLAILVLVALVLFGGH
jgi:hypothetical protein